MGEKEVVILRHVPNEDAGTILDYLRLRKIPVRTVALYEPGHPLPDLKGVRALVVMGGPMNVYEEDKYPFLKEEDRYIQEAVRRKVPYLGICLGSQLLAKALGAKVYKAKREEIGWDTVDLLPQASGDKVFGPLKISKLKVLQWHGDTFDLPKGASHLASAPAVPNQAYAVDGLFYGLQFHVEVNRPMLEDWFKKRPDLTEILKEFDGYRSELASLTGKMYDAFFSLS